MQEYTEDNLFAKRIESYYDLLIDKDNELADIFKEMSKYIVIAYNELLNKRAIKASLPTDDYYREIISYITLEAINTNEITYMKEEHLPFVDMNDLKIIRVSGYKENCDLKIFEYEIAFDSIESMLIVKDLSGILIINIEDEGYLIENKYNDDEISCILNTLSIGISDLKIKTIKELSKCKVISLEEYRKAKRLI